MITINRTDKIVRATIPLTSSKSISNRLLIIRALCGDRFEIENISVATDSQILRRVVENLPDEINVEDSGTAFRFLTAFLSIQEGTFVLTGSQRMKQRPIGKLVNALRSIGAEIEFVENENFPPLKITGKKLNERRIVIDASESSQFISALLLIAPTLENGLEIELTGKINSRSYIDMTLSLLKEFGITFTTKGNYINIEHQDYCPTNIKVENDWSSAAFWYEVAALSDNAEIILKGLKKKSIQGDAVIDNLMKAFGVFSMQSGDDIIIRKKSNVLLPSFFEYEFSSCPDIVIPVAFVCAALKINSEFKGVKNLRIKESDRLQALKNELEKIGAEIMLSEDTLSIKPGVKKMNTEIFHSYNDHRMVMASAPLAIIFDQIKIDDHLAVRKSYPEFWDQFKLAGFNCEIT